MHDYVKIHDTYYGPDSPLDGVGRSLLTTLLHLARMHAQRMRAASVACTASVTVTRDACVTVTPNEPREPVPIAWCNGAPLSVRQIAAAAGLTSRQTKRALERLQAIGEIAPLPGGGIALLGYWRTQETPAAARQRRSRARARARDARAAAPRDRPTAALEPAPQNQATETTAERDSHTLSHADSHAPSHAPSHARVTPLLPNNAAAHDADMDRGRTWLDLLCQTLFTRPAPYPSTHHERNAYAELGRKPPRDLARVAATITRLVRARPDVQASRYYTAGHVLRYWPDYLAGEPPSGRAKPLEQPGRPAPLRPATAAELAAEAVL
jgi:hypothetical protein